MSAGTKPATICLMAGDVSGDQYGAQLAAAIHRVAPEVRLVGVGGDAMRSRGVDVLVETTDLSVVGAVDAFRIANQLRHRYRRVRRAISDAGADLVVLVDTEALLVPIGVWLRRRRLPLVLFFPPQVWMWGRWRLRWTRLLARRVISAFDREAELYHQAGVDTIRVGHPLAETVRVNEDPAAALREIDLDPGRPVVGLMPGSRRREFKALLSPILGAARLLQTRNPALQFAVPLASEAYRSSVEQAVRASDLRDIAIYRPTSYAVLSRARVVLQASGTATLETALLGIPSVIGYRCHLVEYLVVRYLYLHVGYIGLPNILLGEMVQPEFFHRHADAEHLASATWTLLTDERRRHAIQNSLSALRQRLGPPNAFSRAAQAVVELLPVSTASPDFSQPGRRVETSAALE